MIRLFILFVVLSTASYGQSSNQKPMKKAIEKVVYDFHQATAERDIAQLEVLLHPEFRVMANRFRGGDGTTLIPREAYLGMMKAEKIGGTAYDVKVTSVAVNEHTAAVEVDFMSKEEASMHLFLLLVQNSNNEWQIISDLPLVAAK